MERSSIAITWWVPTAESWADGDREITCLLTREDGSMFAGSLRGDGS